MISRGDVESDEVLRFTSKYFEDLSEGRRRTVEEYVELFPALPETIRRTFAELESGPHRSSDDVETIGNYEVLEELGRGGQGVVYLAQDRRLHRKVALKVLRAFAAESPAQRARLAREAEAASKLDHPGICTVYEVGEAQGAPYIAMRFLEGRTLAQIVADARSGQGSALEALAGATPPATGSTSANGSGGRSGVLRGVRVVERVARALHVAHESGLVHRDVKPGNIIVTGDGEPVLLDFGLARDESSTDHTLTRTGELLGTPAYMSPEQMRGENPVDRRTDVYSLGVTLYELLTLKRPFDAPTREALYHAVVEGEAPDPRRLNPAIPSDLRIVLEVAMSKDLDRRYRTALDLAEDLERIRTFQPIRARPTPLPQRLRRWVQRNPAATTILAVVTAALVVTFALLREVSSEKAATEQALAESRLLGLVAEAEKTAATDPLLGLLLAREAVAIEPRWETVSQLHRLLAEPLPAAILESEPTRPWTKGAFAEAGGRVAALGQWDAAGTARHLVVGDVASGRIVRALQTEEQILHFEIDPAGERLALAFDGGRVRFRGVADDAADGESLAGALGMVRLPADPSGGVLVFFADGRVVHCDWRGAVVNRLEATPAPVIDLVTAGDGLRLACADGSIEGRDGHGRPVPGPAHRLPEAARSRWFRLSPRGDQVLTARTRRAWLHDLATEEEREITRPRGDAVLWEHLWSGYSADGEHFFTAYQDGAVCLWDRSGRHIRTIGDTGFEVVRFCRFTPDGRRLLVGGWGAAARMFDLQGNELRSYRAPIATLGAALSEDGKRLLTVGESVRVWSLDDGELRRYAGHGGPVVQVTVAPDGRVATGTEYEARCRVWRPDSTEYREIVPDDFEPGSVPEGVFALARTVVEWSADGALLLTGPMPAPDNVTRLWDTDTWTVRARLTGHGRELWDASFSAGGREVFTAGGDGTARRWSRGGEELAVYDLARPAPPGSATNWDFVFCVDSAGDRVITVHGDGSIRLWHVDGGPPIRAFRLGEKEPPNCARFLPDGERFVASYNDGTLRFWSVDGALERTVLGAGAFRVRVSPRGDRLAAAGLDHIARIFRIDGELLAELRGHTAKVVDVAFTRDGTRLLTASVDRTVRTWLVYTEDLLSLAARRAARDLTVEERERYGLTGR